MSRDSVLEAVTSIGFDGNKGRLKLRGSQPSRVGIERFRDRAEGPILADSASAGSESDQKSIWRERGAAKGEQSLEENQAQAIAKGPATRSQLVWRIDSRCSPDPVGLALLRESTEAAIATDLEEDDGVLMMDVVARDPLAAGPRPAVVERSSRLRRRLQGGERGVTRRVHMRGPGPDEGREPETAEKSKGCR